MEAVLLFSRKCDGIWGRDMGLRREKRFGKDYARLCKMAI